MRGNNVQSKQKFPSDNTVNNQSQKEYLRDGYTSNLLEAARNISGDGLPCLTSGSSPRTT